jgi:hypothetical protein
MIVVAVIALLVGVAIPKFADLLDRSKEATIKGKLGDLRSALSIYYSDNEGEYPTNFTMGLTSGSRYLPFIPSITIPSIYAQGNPGHPANNLEEDAAPTQTCPPTISDLATGIWYYIPQGINFCSGNIYVQCTHKDTKGDVWTSH